MDGGLPEVLSPAQRSLRNKYLDEELGEDIKREKAKKMVAIN